MADQSTEVILGVDTHAQVHVAALLDHLGRLQGTLTIPATRAGYQHLLGWAQAHGGLARAGVEGTGTYGAGLTRHLTQAGVQVIEVDRPNRQRRRRRGKSDPTDAEGAARAVLAGEATATPKTRSGIVESIRVLRVARSSAIKARTQAANQLRDLLVTAPEGLRAQLHPLPTARRVAALTAQQPRHNADPAAATHRALWHLARRYQTLTAELEALNADLAALTHQAAPRLLARPGVGVETAGQLLVTAGDNPDRLHSDAALAALCGASPVEASSGKTVRHRLNRGGDRQASNALWVIAFTRLRIDPATRSYAERRTKQGKSTKELLRCLKRYLARELFPLLLADLQDAHRCASPAETRNAVDRRLPEHLDAADHYRIARPAQVADQQELAWLAIERIYQEFGTPYAHDERLGILTDGQRALYALHWVQSEVRNGGFEQLYHNPAGTFAAEAPHAARLIGAPAYERVFTRANALFPDSVVPAEHKARQQALRQVRKQHRFMLEALDDEFFNLLRDVDIYEHMGRYVTTHPHDFFRNT